MSVTTYCRVAPCAKKLQTISEGQANLQNTLLALTWTGRVRHRAGLCSLYWGAEQLPIIWSLTRVSAGFCSLCSLLCGLTSSTVCYFGHHSVGRHKTIKEHPKEGCGDGKGVEARCARSGWCPSFCSAQRRGEWGLKHESLQNCNIKHKLSTITFGLTTTSNTYLYLFSPSCEFPAFPSAHEIFLLKFHIFPIPPCLLLMIPGLTGLRLLKPRFPPSLCSPCCLPPSFP